MTATYTLDDVLPAAPFDELPPGTSVLLSGPSMTGKRRIAVDLLAAGHEGGDGIVLVTTKNAADDLLSQLESSVSNLDTDRIGLIDCSGQQDRSRIRDVATEQVGSPGDLTGISIGAAKLMQRFADDQVQNVRHGLVSVSTLLQYLDEETVFKFLHIYTSRVDSTDGLAVFTIDSDTHDERTVNTMRGEFDGVVELQEAEDGTVEYRVRGFGEPPSGWTTV